MPINVLVTKQKYVIPGWYTHTHKHTHKVGKVGLTTFSSSYRVRSQTLCASAIHGRSTQCHKCLLKIHSRRKIPDIWKVDSTLLITGSTLLNQANGNIKKKKNEIKKQGLVRSLISLIRQNSICMWWSQRLKTNYWVKSWKIYLKKKS